GGSPRRRPSRSEPLRRGHGLDPRRRGHERDGRDHAQGPLSPEARRAMSPEEFIRLVHRGDEIRKFSVKGMDLSGADLKGAIFYDMDFEGVRFVGADLREAAWVGCR